MKKNHMPIFQNPDLDGASFYRKKDSRLGVLLMHGFTATTAEVRPLADAFTRMGWTVSAPLLPGHGTSPQDMNRQKFQDWVKCAENAWQDLRRDCEVTIVGGESMGAVLSLCLAEKHPEIAALLLYSPALRVDRLKYAKFFKYFIPVMEKSNNDPEDTRWQGYTVNPLFAAHELLKLQKQVTVQLSRVQQPALILQGKYDKTIHPDSGTMIHAQISSKTKRLILMQESGHVMLLDRELEKIVSLSIDFLKDADIL